MYLSSSNTIPREPLEAAAYWVLRLESQRCGPADRAAFEAWRAESPEHAQAFAQTQRALGTLDRHLSDDRLMELGEEAYRSSGGGRRPWGRRAAVGLAAVWMLAVGAAVFWSTQLIPDQSRPHTADTRERGATAFETRVGERSTFTLSDESIVTLNTDSLVSVDFTERSDVRRLRLERGQAMFEVAKDGRPFEVYAADRRVIAVGTIFDVRLEPDQQSMSVTLVEGLVDVEEVTKGDSGPGERNEMAARAVPPTRLEPGEQLIAKSQQRPVVIDADLEQATGWRDGRLVFRGDSLPRAIAEINRYSERKLVVSDQEQLERIRVSGVFTAGGTRSFIEAIESIHPVRAHTLAYDRIELLWLGSGASLADSEAKKVRAGMRKSEAGPSAVPEDRVN